ncbi:hypothetical protein I553_8231 [Mycobacterium xenopi 4042]|uniref:Uncharacterized protein n=1 Tax=Mycobacterium xenopi 4042 TaxID=1299334 RepID=X8BIG8_MYCXE|nr:hypothetical protein I553_8231 [Mycobacterium xenopi 4042]
MRGARRYLEPLGRGRLARLGRRHPACRVTGAMTTPAATSAVTSSVVKGRAALGISALPA